MLDIAVENSRSAEVIRKLLELGADPLRIDTDGTIPATIAHADCQVEAAKVFAVAEQQARQREKDSGEIATHPGWFMWERMQAALEGRHVTAPQHMELTQSWSRYLR
jgi:hypothetical protein